MTYKIDEYAIFAVLPITDICHAVGARQAEMQMKCTAAERDKTPEMILAGEGNPGPVMLLQYRDIDHVLSLEVALGQPVVHCAIASK